MVPAVTIDEATPAGMVWLKLFVKVYPQAGTCEYTCAVRGIIYLDEKML